MTGSCGMRNAAGIRPPSSSGASTPDGAAATRPSRSGSGSHGSKLRRPSSPRPAGYRGPAGTPVPGRDRRALCQQHCGFLLQSTWCVGHAGTEAACAAVPVSITVGPAAKAVARAAEASTYVRAAQGRPCLRLIDFPFGRRLGAAARVGVSRSAGAIVSGTAWPGPLKQR